MKRVHSFEAVRKNTSIMFQFVSKYRDLIERITHKTSAVVDSGFPKKGCAHPQEFMQIYILFGNMKLRENEKSN